MNNWISVDIIPPKDPDWDYGVEWESIQVVFTDGKQQWIGYQRVDLEIGTNYWIMKGPDAYIVQNVTHWKHLDELPDS